MPTKFSPSKRVWWIAGLAGLAVVAAACLLVCGLGAFWLQRTFIGDSPGQGERAQRGYQACAPIIAALAKYHAAQGQYPAKLDALLPGYLAAIPPAVNGYPLEYHTAAGSYSLEFSYERPGMNHCTYTPEKAWSCYGYF